MIGNFLPFKSWIEVVIFYPLTRGFFPFNPGIKINRDFSLNGKNIPDDL